MLVILKSFTYIVITINSELRKRFIDSVEYLKKMDFLEDYSILTAEEILEKYGHCFSLRLILRIKLAQFDFKTVQQLLSYSILIQKLIRRLI